MDLNDNTERVINKIQWKPEPKQSLFLSIPWTIKEAMYGGGAGSGKSDVLLMYGIVHRLHENPKFKQVFMRRTTPDLKKEIVPRSREIYRHFGATFNATDMVWTFPRPDQYGSGERPAGAMIFLAHCEEEKDVHNFDSMEISLYTPDENTLLTEYIYTYIAFERNRSPKGSGLPSITRTAGMPGGIGHTFVKKRFIDPCPTGNKIIVGRGGNKRIYVHATLADNSHIDPTYSQSLDGRPEAERKAKKFGDWSAYLGQVFDEFRDKHYTDEPDNALHVTEPFEIPYWWPRFVIGDWGYRAMTYIMFCAVSPTGRLYIYRELYFTQTKIEEWAPSIKHYIENENVKVVKFCRSASQNRGQEHTIQEQISEALEQEIELSDNNAGTRVAGKMLIHEYLRWKARPIIPSSEMPIYSEEQAMFLLRNKGLESYKSYLNIFNPPEAESNLPKMQIFQCNEENHDSHPNCCPVLIDSIKACNYDKPRNNKPAEDVMEFEGDDPYDTLRYACATVDDYINESSDSFKELQRQASLMERIEKNNNFTMMHHLSVAEDNMSEFKMVRRFHH